MLLIEYNLDDSIGCIDSVARAYTTHESSWLEHTNNRSTWPITIGVVTLLNKVIIF